MSLKLSRLKKWLTLDDSAKFLSLLSSEEITVTDLLHMALQGDLTLSINLVNSYVAKIGSKIPIHEARLRRAPSLKDMGAGKPFEEIEGEEKKAFIKALVESHKQNSDPDLERGGVDKPELPRFDTTLFFEGEVFADYSATLKFERDIIQRISGLWDLPMFGAEALVIQDAFYSAINGPAPDWVSLCGVFLKHPTANQWANLCAPFDEKNVKLIPDNFYPSSELPEREPIVIRRDELQRFADTLNEPSPTLPAATDDDSEVARLQRTVAALALGLMREYPKYRHGDKPNISKLTDLAIDHLRSEDRDQPLYGFGKSTINDTIKVALKRYQELSE